MFVECVGSLVTDRPNEFYKVSLVLPLELSFSNSNPRLVSDKKNVYLQQIKHMSHRPNHCKLLRHMFVNFLEFDSVCAQSI